ncbi:MAG: type VI secretion system baseplate subunit TssE [Pseudomonadota bacterium]
MAQISKRSTARRQGVNEETLRDHVRDHLALLMNSIRLDAVESLDDYPEIKASVLNYGFQDLSNLDREELVGHEIRRSIKQSLIDHEPRLVPGSIAVQVKTEGDVQQRVSVHVTADLIADPADIPIEFTADVDTDAGKVSMASRRI